MEKLNTYVRYFGVLGAALVFISWLVTNSLVERAKSSRERMEAVVEFQRQQERFMLMWNRFQNTDRLLTTIDQKLDEVRQTSLSTDQVGYFHAYRKMQTLGVVSQELSDLSRFSGELAKTADLVESAPELRTRAVILAAAAQKMSTDFNALSDQFHLKEGTITHGQRNSPYELSPDQTHALVEAIDECDRQSQRVAGRYVDLSNQALRLSSDLFEHATQVAHEAGRRAHIAQVLSYFCFAAGTLLALWAKYKETDGKSEEMDVPDA